MLGRKPVRVTAFGEAFVLFREGGAVHCLKDRCPHRAAPLSGGRVVAGGIECPYHGWRFDSAGFCQTMPGLPTGGAPPRIAVASRPVWEEGGLIFVSEGAPGCRPYIRGLTGERSVSAIAESRVRARLLDVAENILDATHTHFTHKGLLRGLGGRRRPNIVTLSAGPGWVEARYEGEARQDGLISKLLEPGRSVSIGRFRAPGIAELEFHGPRGINLVTSFHLREETPGVTHGLAILAGPWRHGLGLVKAVAFLPLFRAALGQDRRILEACSRNAAGAKAMISPLDILRPHIEAVLAGRVPELPASEVIMEL